MKSLKNVIASFFIMLSLTSLAQTETEIINYAADSTITKYYGLPVVREINGGTIINITYEEAWSNEM